VTPYQSNNGIFPFKWKNPSIRILLYTSNGHMQTCLSIQLWVTSGPGDVPCVYLGALASHSQTRQATYYKRNTEARSRNHCCRRKAISITCSECVSVALVIQHAKRMRLIILLCVVCLVVPYFSALSHKRHDFREKVIEHKMCVLILSTTLSEAFLILRRIQRDITINVHRRSCKVPLLLSDFNGTWNCWTHLRKIVKYQISRKIRLVVVELFHAEGRTDGQTDRHEEASSRFSQFCVRAQKTTVPQRCYHSSQTASNRKPEACVTAWGIFRKEDSTTVCQQRVRFSRPCCRRSKSSGEWRRVVGREFPDVSKTFRQIL
jgi:hypothetical protein